MGTAVSAPLKFRILSLDTPPLVVTDTLTWVAGDGDAVGREWVLEEKDE